MPSAATLSGLQLNISALLGPALGGLILPLAGPNMLTMLANVLLSGVFILMAFVRQPQLFFGVAVLAGICWTVSASELWVAGQRAMPGWARGRMNATIIKVGQGAIALGGVVWGSNAFLNC